MRFTVTLTAGALSARPSLTVKLKVSVAEWKSWRGDIGDGRRVVVDVLEGQGAEDVHELLVAVHH